VRQLIHHNAWRLKIGREQLNRERLLAALCRQESTGWKDRRPNFEPAFYLRGKFANLELINRWQTGVEPALYEAIGLLVASSLGPWQIMFPVAVELGFTGHPCELADPAVNIEFAIRYVNQRCLAKGLKDQAAGGDETGDGQVTEDDLVKQIADAFNSGTHLDRWKPEAYMDQVLAYYHSPTLFADLAELPDWYPRKRQVEGPPEVYDEPVGTEGAHG
jgi:hypothetical protein